MLLILLRLTLAQDRLLNVLEVRTGTRTGTGTWCSVMATASSTSATSGRAKAQGSTVASTVPQGSTLVHVRRHIIHCIADCFWSDADVLWVEPVKTVVGDVARILIGERCS